MQKIGRPGEIHRSTFPRTTPVPVRRGGYDPPTHAAIIAGFAGGRSPPLQARNSALRSNGNTYKFDRTSAVGIPTTKGVGAEGRQRIKMDQVTAVTAGQGTNPFS